MAEIARRAEIVPLWRAKARRGLDHRLIAHMESGRELPFGRELITFYALVDTMEPEYRAYMGLIDRYYLLLCLLHRLDLLKHQDKGNKWLYERCREVEAYPDDHLDLWGRNHYKSTLITFAGVIQEILRDPELTVGIFSHSAKIARKFLWQIMIELETNDELKVTYPTVCWWEPKREAPRWSLNEGIVVKRRSNPGEATVEAWGLVDGQPTSKHFMLRVYDDVWTRENVTTAEQIKKTQDARELSENLGRRDGRQWNIGTRYCTIGSMRILMADWSHKPIEDVRIGDEIVGWESRDKCNSRRFLRPAKVINRGMHPMQPVNRYVLTNGRSVTCTSDHNWWRGPHGGGPEYAPLGQPRPDRPSRPAKTKKAHGKLSALRELLVPSEIDQGRDAGWLAGFFDGEGTMSLNKGENRASGAPCITQTMANPELIERTRVLLKRLRFEWSEGWLSAEGRERMDYDRCVFYIKGGWRERYRFLAALDPTKRTKLAASLFAALTTERIELESIEDAGTQDVHWLETETGNYVIEGFCSSNSFADGYGLMLDRGVFKARVYPATSNGLLNGVPVFLTQEEWDEKKRKQPSQVPAQLLQNPLAGQEQMFDAAAFKGYMARPRTLNVYIMGDPSKGKPNRRSDRTAIAVIGVDAAGNKYLLDGYRHRMRLPARWVALKTLHRKWSSASGVMTVAVGYEQYGMQTDIEYFEERQRIERYPFPITELGWTNDHTRSKEDRVERLLPDIKGGAFFMPSVVWNDGRLCEWVYNAEQKRILYRPLDGRPAIWGHMEKMGQAYRCAKPIKRVDEEGQVYDLTVCLHEELAYFPFGTHDDLCDGASRIYDMEPVPPTVVSAADLEPNVYTDT